MNTEQLIEAYEQHKSLTKGFLKQQEQKDHKGIAQKIHKWAQTQGEDKTTITQQEIENYLNTYSIGTKPTYYN